MSPDPDPRVGSDLDPPLLDPRSSPVFGRKVSQSTRLPSQDSLPTDSYFHSLVSKFHKQTPQSALPVILSLPTARVGPPRPWCHRLEGHTEGPLGHFGRAPGDHWTCTLSGVTFPGWTAPRTTCHHDHALLPSVGVLVAPTPLNVSLETSPAGWLKQLVMTTLSVETLVLHRDHDLPCRSTGS